MTVEGEFVPGQIKTEAVRMTYARAKVASDGEWVYGSGYKPEDRIGHAVLDTVNGLCNEVDYLRTERETLVDSVRSSYERAKANQQSGFDLGLAMAFHDVLRLLGEP